MKSNHVVYVNNVVNKQIKSIFMNADNSVDLTRKLVDTITENFHSFDELCPFFVLYLCV